jgi:nicotinamide-nucleotide amidase
MTNATTDLPAVAARVAKKLVARKQTIAIAESSAGGLISAALLAIPGASAYFLGGGVIYTVNAREGLLGVTASDMTNMRASTEDYARLLARRMRVKLGADWALSETGATGPTGNRYGDAAGHACFGVSGPKESSRTLETGSQDRASNMQAFAHGALMLLDETLGA